MSQNASTTGKGTKVSGGSTIQEGAGAIPNQSLAAESIRDGGAFAGNRGALPGSAPTHDDKAGAPGSGHDANPPGRLDAQASYAGTAPSYVSTQAVRDTAGPHGTNLSEGGFAGSGTDGGALPEPGSKNDPARAALQGQNANQGRGRGREDEQPFDVLGSEKAL